jgi:hypothetical protein
LEISNLLWGLLRPDGQKQERGGEADGGAKEKSRLKTIVIPDCAEH